MAKMFYTLEEAADRLNKSTDEVVELASSGQIQEFRDRDKLMFKKEQIDLLAGDRDEGDAGDSAGEIEIIGLADSGEVVAMEDKEESVLGLQDSKESTGISIFDADELETADPSAATQVSETVAPSSPEFSLDSQGSGSGLLDLTREVDDTSLGAVLDDINLQEDNLDMPASSSGLFESESAEGEGDVAVGAPMMAPQIVEVYDGAWSGLGVGLAIGAIAALVVACFILITLASGTLPTMAETMAESANTYYMWIGGFAGGTLLLGIIGYFIGRATS